MAQNDFVIADQTASAALADINSALQSLASCSSGETQPSVRYANQLWYDTSTHILKVRNEANSAWINILYVHQADGAVHIIDNTYISDTAGNHVGLLGDQASSEWTTGTGTTESLVSPAKIKAAILALASVEPTNNFTLIGSHNAASAVTFSGVDLTPYNFLWISAIWDTNSAASEYRLNGTFIGNNSNDSPYYGAHTSLIPIGGRGWLGYSAYTDPYVNNTSQTALISTSTTSLAFSVDIGTWEAHTLYVYGVN